MSLLILSLVTHLFLLAFLNFTENIFLERGERSAVFGKSKENNAQ